jgi:hypothetical protein
MDGDGANIHQIGKSTLFEGHASLMPDGRVLYYRWEYVDRNFGDAQGLWTVNPDGTAHTLYWGNNMASPPAVFDGRAIPGTDRVVCIFGSCHDRPWGAMAIVDRSRGLDSEDAVVRIWPASARSLVKNVEAFICDHLVPMRSRYEDPFPLVDPRTGTGGKYFLVSRNVNTLPADKPIRHSPDLNELVMGLYLVDVFGNEILLHAEAPGCFDPMPLGPRARPPVITPRTELARSEGSFLIGDVYVGTGMEAVPRGTVKHLRVVESPEKRFWTHPAWDGGTGQQAPGMNWDDFNNKRILGTAPVEADGSAYFTVPAGRFIYFQLLDERGMMIQSMRSATVAQPGETTGCVGCHEGRRSATSVAQSPKAARRAPSRLESWYGPPRNFSYLAEVQPVLDKHCVSCHDYGQPAGKKLNLAGDVGLIFNTSYVELRTKGYVRVVGAGPPEVLPPKHWGSHTSPLAKTLLAGHGDAEIDRKVKLDREAIDRIVTWIDINAPYYPEYSTAFPENLFGRAPIDMGQVQRLGQLVGLNLADRSLIAAVSFTRPEMSACLASLANQQDSRRQEALAILESGKQKLSARLSNPETRAEDPSLRGLQRLPR